MHLIPYKDAQKPLLGRLAVDTLSLTPLGGRYVSTSSPSFLWRI